jgi:hypothetical protein
VSHWRRFAETTPCRVIGRSTIVPRQAHAAPTGGFYDIKDKTGAKVPFRMNADQEDFILNRHGLDVILKARQRGFTTVIQLDMLDDCLFTSNLSAGVIAHNLKDAKAFFGDKIKFAYDNLPEPFRKLARPSRTAPTA